MSQTKTALKIVWTSVFLSCQTCLFCEIPRVDALVSGLPARKPISPVRLNAVVYGDDFAGYDLNDIQREEGQRLAREFYKEIKIRQDLSSTVETSAAKSSDQAVQQAPPTATAVSQSATTTSTRNPRAMNSAGFFKPGRRIKVYSSGRGGSAMPLPPKPTYGAPARLSISGLIAVVLISRFFWAQALVSIGLIALYIVMVILTSNGSGDWLGASLGGHISTDPIMERTTSTSLSDNDGL